MAEHNESKERKKYPRCPEGTFNATVVGAFGGRTKNGVPKLVVEFLTDDGFHVWWNAYLKKKKGREFVAKWLANLGYGEGDLRPLMLGEVKIDGARAKITVKHNGLWTNVVGLKPLKPKAVALDAASDETVMDAAEKTVVADDGDAEIDDLF